MSTNVTSPSYSIFDNPEQSVAECIKRHNMSPEAAAERIRCEESELLDWLEGREEIPIQYVSRVYAFISRWYDEPEPEPEYPECPPPVI